MKVYTVVSLFDGDVFPFVIVYRDREAAQSAVEQSAIEDFEAMVDPNDGEKHVFPGLTWSDDKTTAWIDAEDEAAGSWVITEAQLLD